MSKRRRASSAASRGPDDDSLDSNGGASTSSGGASTGPTSRKRRKQSDPTEICHQLYELLRSRKKHDGSPLCDLFIRAPKRRQEPSYYSVVSNPMDLLKVQQKLRTDEYRHVDDLQKDIELIVNNAKAFYKRNSPEYKDAVELWACFDSNKKRLLTKESGVTGITRRSSPASAGHRPPAPPSPARIANNNVTNNVATRNGGSPNTDQSRRQYEELFEAVMTATDDDGKKPLHPAFQLLPSKKKYPEYYEVIEQPIDLRRIAQRIRAGHYISILGLERDLMLMCKNACLFNEPSSQIYKSAKQLKKIVQMKRIEITERFNGRGRKNSIDLTPTPRPRVGRPSRFSLERVSRLKGEDSETENEITEPDEKLKTALQAPRSTPATPVTPATPNHRPQDEPPVDPNDPKWKLLEKVRLEVGSDGKALAEPFWRLPSRRFYPDYYREIKNPVSLTQIRRKLVGRLYGTVSEVAGDMTVMLENAKRYNDPNSKLYKDAVRLQKVMQTKVQELLDVDKGFKDDTVASRGKNRPPGVPAQRGRPPKDAVPLKKRLHALAKHMLDFACPDGRKPMLAFMEKPSKKLYPDYYEVIAEPIDFLEIEKKIKAEQYSCEKDMVKDFLLMFANCREFNEENSPIYEDATMLEKHLMDRAGKLLESPVKKERQSGGSPRTPRPRKPPKEQPPHNPEKALRTLYETVRDYRDPTTSRELAPTFHRLPSKADYPDYFEVILNPLDLERVGQRLRASHYKSLDELGADLALVFDNACKYNEPDSRIYKDALELQRVALQTRLKLKEEEEATPDAPAALQALLLALFAGVYNHADSEGRCYSDSMAELPEHDIVDGHKIRPLSLDLLKRRLDRGVYRRLDVFQEDFFLCLERARRLSRPESQAFDDALELQLRFVRLRDELCQEGSLLRSPALGFREEDARKSHEEARSLRLKEESVVNNVSNSIENDNDESRSSGTVNSGSGENSMTCDSRTFRVGEFVYVDAEEEEGNTVASSEREPQILLIERLYEQDGRQMLRGNVYLRPAETFHVSTRKFLEREVFKSDAHRSVALSDVRERCIVIDARRYYTMKPEGYEDKDVYVSESRYSMRTRSFKKMKLFPELLAQLVTRDEPLEPRRVVSVFRERVEKHKDELQELQENEALEERRLPNVRAEGPENDGNTYYEQYNTVCSGVVKTGDFVYVVADGGRQAIAQVDTIWDTKDGKCYFRGPWFLRPTDIPYTPTRLYYRNEVLLGTLEEVSPLVSIVGRCSVLEYADYLTVRDAVVPESDTFICVSMYDETDRQVRPLPSGALRPRRHQPPVALDEIYRLPRPLGPPKKTQKNKVVTGYILYSREVRKQVVQNNPESKFGDISRIVGSEWKALTTQEKQVWEERASRLNEETKAQLLADERCASPQPGTPAQAPAPIENAVFECGWDTCDWQFEEVADCLEHSVKDSKDSQGHVQAYFSERPGAELQCRWRGCARASKKNLQPFPNVARLIRHVRDMHINKGNGRSVPPEQRSRNFKPSSKGAANRAPPSATPASSSAASSSLAASGASLKPAEPLFISVPPRPQRVLHSEAYIRYIEGLQQEQRFISPWEKTLNATPESHPPPDVERLQAVATWLGQKGERREDVVAALWTLRDQLLRDTLCLHKTL